MNSKIKILIVLVFIVVFCNLVSCAAPQTPVPAIYVSPATLAPEPEKNSDDLISGEKLPKIKPTRIFVDEMGWTVMYRFDDTYAICYVSIHNSYGSSSVPFCFERK